MSVTYTQPTQPKTWRLRGSETRGGEIWGEGEKYGERERKIWGERDKTQSPSPVMSFGFVLGEI